MAKKSTTDLKQKDIKAHPLYPRSVRKVVLGRGLMLDSETFEQVLSLIENRVSGITLKRCQYILEMRKDLLSRSIKSIRRAFGPYWKTYVIPVVKEDTFFNTQKSQKDEWLFLRKDSKLFENECSFILGSANIFLPGVFPFVEIDLYEKVGDAVFRFVLNM